MSRAKPITPAELAEIKDSVAQAVREKGRELTCLPGFRKMIRRGVKLSPAKQLQLRILWVLESMQCRSLREQPIPKVIAQAVEDDDMEFFIKLGTVLSKAPVEWTTYRMEPGMPPTLTRLEQFVLTHWATAKDGLPELFYLTPEGLAAVCNFSLRTRQITADSVVKLRQRLGLKPFKRQKLAAILVGNELRFPEVDKQFLQNPVQDE